ncbi:MAG: c-type cytochrome domain-containing protein [Chthoniobacter sp.]
MPRPIIVSLLLSLTAAHLAHGTDAAALWSSKVQPLFDVNCVKCHGPLEQKSGLELDTPQAVLKGGEDGAVIVPGKPEDSALYQNLATKADPHMPPKKQLTDAERDTVREWIAALTAAQADTTAKPHPPRHFDSITQAVDTLIGEGWAEHGVQPAPPVDDRTWCRRVYLDLAGRIPHGDRGGGFSPGPGGCAARGAGGPLAEVRGIRGADAGALGRLPHGPGQTGE